MVLAETVQQKVKLLAGCGFVPGLLREKELVHGNFVTVRKAADDLNAGGLPHVFDVRKETLRDIHSLTRPLPRFFAGGSLRFHGPSERLGIKQRSLLRLLRELLLLLFCHFKSPCMTPVSKI